MLHLLALALLPSLNGASDPAVAPSVLRMHDIGAAAPRVGRIHFLAGLVPLIHGNYLEVESDVQPHGDADALVDLLRAMNPEEWEYAGRELNLGDDGRLLVQAPAALQESTARFLAWMEREIGRSTDLIVDVVTLPAGASGAPIPAIVTAAEVERHVQGAVAHRRYALTSTAGGTARIRDERAVRIVVDYDVEIAESTNMFDPVVVEQRLGLRLFATAAPGPNGLWLALVCSETEAIGGIEERELRYDALVSAKERLSMLSAPRARQDLPFVNRSLALSTFLPDGKALALQTEVAAGGGRGPRVVFVRAERPAPTILTSLPREVFGAASTPGLMLLEHGSVAPPGIELESSSDSGGLPGDLGSRFGSGLWLLAARIVRGDTDAVLDRLNSDGPPSREVELWDSWALLRTAPRAGGDSRAGELPDAAELLGLLVPTPRTATVNLALRHGAGGRAIARCTLPIRAGAPSAAVLGDERLVLADFDVEVACGSSVADPVIASVFQGLVVRLDARATADGGLSIEIDARASTPRGPQREFALGTPLLGAIDGQDADRLEDRRRLVLPKGPGSARIVMGDGSATSGGLMLEVEASN